MADYSNNIGVFIVNKLCIFSPNCALL